MTTYYIDPSNGNDANPGTSWGAALKTIKGAAASLISPADIIRVAKSPDPISLGNAAWTNLSKVVTLSTSGLTASVDLCNSTWTASTNITSATSASYRKEGSLAIQLTPAAAFTTGKMAYKDLGASYNFSAYQRLSFWFRTTAAIAENVLKICLCSDTAGNTIVDEFVIPAVESASASAMIPVVIDKGSALGSAIQSVAIYAITDPGVPVIQIDNIIACNDFSLCSLISKNPNATGGDEAWYPIQSINNTNILLDNGITTTANLGRGYYGISETTQTYYRNCHRLTTTTDCVVQDSGTSGNLIEFHGGYNTSSGNQDGETFFDVGSGVGNGLNLASRAYVLLNRLNMVRSSIGLNLNATHACQVTAHTIVGCTTTGVTFVNSYSNTLTIKNVINHVTDGLYFATTVNTGNSVTIDVIANCISNGISTSYCYNNKIIVGTVVNCGAENVLLGNITYNNVLKITNSKNAVTYGITFTDLTKDNIIVGTTFSSNTTASINYPTRGNNHLRNCSLSDTTKIAGQVAYADARLSSENQDGTTTTYLYTDGTSGIKTQTSVRHTAADIAWQLSPTSTNRSATYPLTLSVLQLAVNAGTQVTVSCWLRRTHIGLSVGLLCKGLQIAGVDSDVISYMTSAQDTWEQVSINFTPTEQGVVEILAFAYGGTTYSAYIDDIDYSQT